MTAPAHPVASAEAAVVAYEELRRYALAAAPHGGGMGWVVLVREGVATWIDHGAAALAAAGSTPARDPVMAGPPVVPPLHVDIVHVLATIALTRRQEATSP